VFPIHATAAATDLDRALRWFAEKLGLVPEREDEAGIWFRFAGDAWLYVYGTPSAARVAGHHRGAKPVRTLLASPGGGHA
jgi:catechol 2,3-dioxygenase-like lactoylglutathione lyase family enzyme